jgi:hypothetical protein
MFDVYKTVSRLRKYFSLLRHKEIPMSELVSSNESLKHIGKAWNETGGGDIWMILTLSEYQFTSENSYSPDEIAAIRAVTAKIARNIEKCGKEWAEYDHSKKE